eukprot:gb/GECG01001688.1/.p1 GENE.gb/GECG01001688.1/~~gb/GECG01001688.1/.p1  ORF type:complete len:135 (+),score=10.29 gb/GECG01001688.1/:1-405(+)
MPPRTSKPLHERILAAMEPAKPSLSSLYDCLIKEGNEPVAVEKDPASLIDGLGYTLLHRAVLDGYSELIPILIDNYNVPVNSTSEVTKKRAGHRLNHLDERECLTAWRYCSPSSMFSRTEGVCRATSEPIQCDD